MHSPLVVVGCDSVNSEKLNEYLQVISVVSALFVWPDKGMKS